MISRQTAGSLSPTAPKLAGPFRPERERREMAHSPVPGAVRMENLVQSAAPAPTGML